MKVPLVSYTGDGLNLKVFSYVIDTFFTPLDVGIGRLVQEFGWNPEVDRFRARYIPRIHGKKGQGFIYLTLRKLDVKNDILFDCRINFNPHVELKPVYRGEPPPFMTISMLCNDDEYPHKVFSLFVNQPPAYHGLEEFKVIQKAWVDDKEVVVGFRAQAEIAESVAKEWSRKDPA